MILSDFFYNFIKKMSSTFFRRIIKPQNLVSLQQQFNTSIRYAPDHYYDNVERYRRFGIARKNTENKWNIGRSVPFIQSSAYNKYLGNVTREYARIYEDFVDTEAFQDLLNDFYDEDGPVKHKKDIEPSIYVHYIRVVTNIDIETPTELAPEKLHQDGYARIAMACIARENIIGGMSSIAYDSEGEEILGQFILQPGEVISFNDRKYWHAISTMLPKNSKNGKGYRDIIVMTTYDY